MSGDPILRKTSQTFPDFRGPWLPQKPLVRILLVTDDDGSFSQEHKFGLTELVDALESTPGVFVEFQVTKAHRSAATGMFTEPAEADIQEFRFDNPAHFDPAEFDQVWLVGILEKVAGSLGQAELKAVAQFMDQGGGVFATGDHFDIGGALCGDIPRVRSMRKWTYDYAAFGNDGKGVYDPSSPHGPPVYGPFRHDTLVAGHDTAYTFDDQSDDIPARIYPRFYGTSNRYFSHKFPHPLLCGPAGVIDVLPDHMHEGECVVPADLSQTFTFDGYTNAEYPSDGDGVQPVPEVIAQGEVLAHVTDNQDVGIVDVMSNAREFGVIGAYDGHRANVGRVVVDSTFHHFVNINVVATGANSPDPVKQVGFAASPEGQEAYDQIRAYWRNIAIWLARPAQQTRMFNQTLWAARWDSQLRMVLPGLVHQDNVPWNEMLNYGGSVFRTMSRLISPCATFSWFFAWQHPLARYPWWVRLTLPDPPPWEIGEVFIDPYEYVIGAFGAVMRELVRATPTRDARFRDTLHEQMPAIVRQGLALAARTALPHYERRLRETEKMLAEIRAAAQPAPTAKGRGGRSLLRRKKG